MDDHAKSAVEIVFGLSYVLAGLLTGWLACGATEMATEGRRESTVLIVKAAALVVVAALAIAGGTTTVVVAFR